MSDGHVDTRPSVQKQLWKIENGPKSVTMMAFEWKAIVQQLYDVETAVTRFEATGLNDLANQVYDLTELVGRLALKIEEWVGVAEEEAPDLLIDHR